MTGLTSTGFVTKRLNDVIADLKAKAVTKFGANINTEDDSLLGQLIDVFAPEFVSLWELQEAIYNGYIPSGAEDAQLDDVCSIIGIARQPETSSKLTLTLYGDPGTVIPAASTFSKSTDSYKFDTDEATDLVTATGVTGVLISVVTVANTTDYTVTIDGEAVTYTSDASATALEICDGLVDAINTDTVTSLLVLATDNLDETITIRTLEIDEPETFVVTANLSIDKAYQGVAATSQVAGAVRAPIGTIDTIDTPISGLDSVDNEEEPNLGRSLETDAELRVRRALSLSLAGSSTPDAIRAAVGNVTGVSTVFVVENITNAIDGDGRPAKSFEVIVEGGDDDDIAQAIYDNKPAGIETTNRGSQAAVTATDAEGNSIDIYFSRPVSVTVDLEIDYSYYTEETFPSGGEAAIALAAYTYGQALGINKDVIPPRFLGPIYTAVTGIGDMEVRARVGADPYSIDIIPINPAEVAVFDYAQILANVNLI